MVAPVVGRSPVAVDSTLAYMDQASFLWVRASGHVHGLQCTWVYPRGIDDDGLRRLHDNLAHGLLGRRVEPSPFPMGRHRWVACHELPGIDIAQPVRGRAALAEWVNERARVPVDPEFGPCWHLGVLPMQDHGTAVSLVASHTVADGVGVCRAVADAVKGVREDLGYPPPRSRLRRRAFVEDARQAARGLSEVGGALVAMTKLAIHNRPSLARQRARPRSTPSDGKRDRPVVVPTATVYIDVADWDARAEQLGGTSNTLFAAVAAKLAERTGRVRAGDNRVTLSYPVNDRGENDLRANALKGIDFPVDPTPVTSDLKEIRGVIKQSLISGLGKFAEQERVLPLTALVPTAVVRKLPLASMNADDLPVGCSNLGDIDPAVARADGTEAEHVSVRLIEQNLTEKSPEVADGELYLMSGRICGKLFITVRLHQPGAQNSRHVLGDLVASTLAEFDMAGVIE